MRIEVFGPGCSLVRQMAEQAREIAYQLDPSSEVALVTNLDRIIAEGISVVPVIRIDGRMAGAGRILSRTDLEGLLEDLTQ